jgi:REP element-mobilizing transposase RayT
LEAKKALKYPPVRFNEIQRQAIARGFAQAVLDAQYSIFACCIGHDHAHLVMARHEREMNVIAGHLKSVATRELTEDGIHPLEGFIGKRGGLPTPWAEGCWKVFIDTIDVLKAAIRYVERHPEKEGIPAQEWNFVTPLAGELARR